MIDKNANVIKDPKIKRIVQYSEDNKQINVLDQRFYRRNELYYPSVSSILNYFPKNQFFHAWLKDVGTLTIKGIEWRLQEYIFNPRMPNHKLL